VLIEKRNKKGKEKREEKKLTAAEMEAGQWRNGGSFGCICCGAGLKRKSKDTRGYERIKVYNSATAAPRTIIRIIIVS